MTAEHRSERTARILSARLEELAHALERAGAPAEAAARLLKSPSVATANAVALDLLTAEAAETIWREVSDRHPQIAPLRTTPPYSLLSG
jgi:cobalamin biosynthesis protein CbiD